MSHSPCYRMGSFVTLSIYNTKMKKRYFVVPVWLVRGGTFGQKKSGIRSVPEKNWSQICVPEFWYDRTRNLTLPQFWQKLLRQKPTKRILEKKKRNRFQNYCKLFYIFPTLNFQCVHCKSWTYDNIFPNLRSQNNCNYLFGYHNPFHSLHKYDHHLLMTFYLHYPPHPSHIHHNLNTQVHNYSFLINISFVFC